MHNAAALLEINARAHSCLKSLIEHCGQFSAEELDHKFDGFGGGPIRMQLHHTFGAQIYWISVLQGGMNVDENPEDYESIEALEIYRQQAFADTEGYLRATSDEELNTPQNRKTWGGNEYDMVAAHVVMRTVAHMFQHQGQVLAMCRLLGKPKNGLDYPWK